MQSLVLLCLAILAASVHANVYRPPGYLVGQVGQDADYYHSHPHHGHHHPHHDRHHPHHDHHHHHRHRQPRDLTWERNAGRGRVFGTLGSTDDSLFGRGGYRQDIFNDRRGRLQGEAYGTRVLGAGGDSSIYGGKLNWNNANDNFRAGLDVHKEIGRGSGMELTGDGVWKLDHNTRFVAGGNLHKNFGHDMPEVGIQGAIEHDF